MKTIKNIIFYTPLILATLFCGCNIPEGAVEIIMPQHTPDPSSEEVAKRYSDYSPETKSAVESAVELSKKHAELAEQLTAARQQIQLLTDKNNQLALTNQDLNTKLDQSQKELNEANWMLQEMVVELNNWKTQVTGFQQEMREADKAQIDALIKILTLLGGEVPQIETAQQASKTNEVSSASNNSRITQDTGVQQ